jgi:hypothetical protein
MSKKKISHNEGPCPGYDCEFYEDVLVMCQHCTSWTYHPDYGTKSIPDGEKATFRDEANW